ncbi:hypothetical protein DPMN_094147 [Dreissena polymorpha]|uniref:Uncharacterized protein n=1 Tax=Dreissena polymorpha TaxID=45954 RepID=A0A9D4L5G8_DREPO|nr:hypothetical protein DPMN_094147 [Dreissena polymorpha]
MNFVEFFNAVTLFLDASPVEDGQQPGRVPVNHGLATVYPGESQAAPRLSPVMPRLSPGESRQRAALLMYRSYTGTLTAFTWAPPGRCRSSNRVCMGYAAVPVVPGAVPVVSGAATVVAGSSR